MLGPLLGCPGCPGRGGTRLVDGTGRDGVAQATKLSIAAAEREGRPGAAAAAESDHVQSRFRFRVIN